MANFELSAEPRSIVGKKVRFLRRQGMVPGNVYGHAASTAIQIPAREVEHTIRRAGRTQLISLAVAAQIPCQYCIWSDTRDAKAAGATDEEIGEAVTMAALTRHWSTIFNGMQVDFDTFKKEMGGE